MTKEREGGREKGEGREEGVREDRRGGRKEKRATVQPSHIDFCKT